MLSSIQVTWNTAGTGVVKVSYLNPEGCSPPAAEKPVTVIPAPGPAGMITGPAAVCTGTSGVTYSVAPVQNATSYEWVLPPAVTVLSGAGTRTITVVFSNYPDTVQISVYGRNDCFSGASSPVFQVQVNQLLSGQTVLQNITIPASRDLCQAAQIITTAGNGTAFIVHNAGQVESASGRVIRVRDLSL